MRFFACDAWVEENCRIEHLVGVARSVLENKETGFMVTVSGEDIARCMIWLSDSINGMYQWRVS
jgi:hypothetical protein